MEDASSTLKPVVEFSKEDLLRLSEYIGSGSPVNFILKSTDYDPEKFCDALRVLKKEWSFIYMTPLNDLPLTMGDPRFEGWRKWRFSIGK